MGIYHDSISRKRDEADGGARVDIAFFIMCVPNSADDDYYSEVVDMWIQETKRRNYEKDKNKAN